MFKWAVWRRAKVMVNRKKPAVDRENVLSISTRYPLTNFFCTNIEYFTSCLRKKTVQEVDGFNIPPSNSFYFRLLYTRHYDLQRTPKIVANYQHVNYPSVVQNKRISFTKDVSNLCTLVRHPAALMSNHNFSLHTQWHDIIHKYSFPTYLLSTLLSVQQLILFSITGYWDLKHRMDQMFMFLYCHSRSMSYRKIS